MATNRSTRSAYYISTLSVSMILFLLGVIAYTVINVSKASEQLMNGMCITVLIKDGIKKDELKALEKSLLATSGVARLEYTSKEDAAAEFRAFAGEDINVFLDENPLPASFDVHLKDSYDAPVEPEKVAAELKKLKGVGQVLYQKEVLEQVSYNVYKVRIIIASFLLALVVISIILISNTIRMVVHSKRFLIKTMRLVGATDEFIRAPFIRDALYQGLSAGVTALVMLTAVILAIGYFSPNMPLVMEDVKTLGLLYAAIMVTGVVICLSSTAITLRRYLRIDNNSLYIY